MPSKDTNSFIISALSSIQETVTINSGVLREASEKVSSVDKKTDVLAEKIIAYDIKHEIYHKEVVEKVKTLEETKVRSLEENQKIARKDLDEILGWKGKVVFLMAALTFIASILGINGVDLLESILKKKNVDIPYVMGVQSYSNYGQTN